jgi:signal peptidase II
MKSLVRILANKPFHLAIMFAGILADQLTKYLAVANLGTMRDLDGFLYSAKPLSVVGDWFWLTLAYNRGAAFSTTPQKILPFLSPNAFYTLIALAAFVGLVFYYRQRSFPHVATRLGVALVIAGGFGNLVDRWRLGRVVDFISWGVPGVAWRWPTFNVADSLICVGVAFLVFADFLDISVFRTRVREPEAGSRPTA